MKIDELVACLESELTYPVERSTVIDVIGDLEIEAPDHDESEQVETILAALSEEEYASPKALFDTILGNLSDDYIGEKYYDDRGGAPDNPRAGRADEIDTSF